MSREVTQDWFERALAFMDLGRLEDADEALRKALREDPDNPLVHGAHAFVLLDLDRPAEALQAASTTIELAPELEFGHQARGQALLSLGRFEAAEDSAREAIRLDPDDADSQVLLGAALLGRRQLDDALTALDRALSLDPESEIAAGLKAVALAVSARGEGWEEAAQQALAAAPGSALAHAFSGQALLLRGGEREAADHFREALRLDPGSEFAQEGLAEAMKAGHPLVRPIFRFLVWQARLPKGWRIALIVGPLLAVRALRPAADHNPLVIGLIAAWFVFVALTWLANPIANVALRFSAVGRAVLPADQKRSSTAFVAFIGAALLSVVFAIALQGGWVLAAFTDVLLAFSVGAVHDLSPRRKRIVYASAFAAGVTAFVGGALLSVRVGGSSLGAILIVAALVSAVVLVWTVRVS